MAIVCYAGLFDPSNTIRVPQKRKANIKSLPKKKLRLSSRSGGRRRHEDSDKAKNVMTVDCTGKLSPPSSCTHKSDEPCVSNHKSDIPATMLSELAKKDVIVMTAVTESSSNGGDSVDMLSDSPPGLGAIELVASQEKERGRHVIEEGMDAGQDPSEEQSSVSEPREEDAVDNELSTSQGSEGCLLEGADTSDIMDDQEEESGELPRGQTSCIVVLDSLGVKRRLIAQQLKK